MKFGVFIFIFGFLSGAVTTKSINVSISIPEDDSNENVSIDNQIAEIVIRTGAYFKIAKVNEDDKIGQQGTRYYRIGDNSTSTPETTVKIPEDVNKDNRHSLEVNGNEKTISAEEHNTPNERLFNIFRNSSYSNSFLKVNKSYAPSEDLPTTTTNSPEKLDNLNEQLLREVRPVGNWTAIDYLLREGADVNLKHKPSGRTLLHWISLQGWLPGVKRIIEEGADINAKDNSGDSPLDLAIINNLTQVAELLKNAGGKSFKEH